MSDQVNTQIEKTTFLQSCKFLEPIFRPSLFGGRFTRMQYWLYKVLGAITFVLSSFIIAFLLVCGKKFGGFVGGVLGVIGIVLALSLFVWWILYFLSVEIKRVHDLGHSGGIAVMMTFGMPVIAFIIGVVTADYSPVSTTDSMNHSMGVSMLSLIVISYNIWLGFFDSQKGTNKYGASTKYPD